MTRREELAQARRLLSEASGDPAVGPCDDAWHTAAIFAGLVDELAAALEPELCPCGSPIHAERNRLLSDLGPDA